MALTRGRIAELEESAPATRPPPRILLIDDNGDLAVRYQRLLRERGDTVAAAASPRRAAPYDLIRNLRAGRHADDDPDD